MNMINNYFDKTGYKESQDLLSNLTAECIQQRGIDIQYIQRDDFSPDYLFGEPGSVTIFENAFTIEMLIDNYSGGSRNDLFEKFGLTINDTLTVQVSIDRFKEEIGKHLDLDEPDVGDLIYINYMNSCWEIKRAFYSDEETLYQLGKNYFITLELELFEPNMGADIFDTGDEAIDEGYELTLNPDGNESSAIDNEIIDNGIITDFDLNNFQF